MDAYCKEIRKLETKFYGLEFHHIPKDDNVAADALSKLGSKWSIVPLGVFVQALNSPTVKMEEEPPTKHDLVPAIGQEVLTLDTDWRSPIIDFIKNNKSYPKGKEHEKLARRSSNYVVIGTEMFRHSASSGTLCKCVAHDEGVQLLSDIHSGICGNHAVRLYPRGKSLPIRLLLAHGPGRCPKHRQAMSWVPVLLQAAARPGSGLMDHTAFLALRLLGTRLGATPKDCRRWIQSHICGD